MSTPTNTPIVDPVPPAKTNLYHKRNKADHAEILKKIKQRLAGSGVAESVEQIEELSQNTLKSYLKKSKDGKADLQNAARKGDKKAQHRLMTNAHGVQKAGDRLKEDVDSIMELAKSTLANYVSRAAGDISTRSRNHGVAIGAGRDSDQKSLAKKYKRVGGVEHALRRLQKEDVEQIDELSDNTLRSYLKKSIDQRKGARKAARAGDTSKMELHNKRGAGNVAAIKRIKEETMKSFASYLNSLEVDLEGAELVEETISEGFLGLSDFHDRLKAHKTNGTILSHDYDHGSKKAHITHRDSEGQVRHYKYHEKGTTVHRLAPEKEYVHKTDHRDSKAGDVLKRVRSSYKMRSGETNHAARIKSLQTKADNGHEWAKKALEKIGHAKLKHDANKNYGKKEHVEESVEQIDELSNGTLNSYIKKSRGEIMDKMREKVKPKGMSKVVRHIAKRGEGIAKAKQRFKEEVEQIEELSNKTLTSYVGKAVDSAEKLEGQAGKQRGAEFRKTMKKVDQRTTGMAAATKRVFKEEVEQIDELSKTTLKSYAGKAANQVAKASVDMDRMENKGVSRHSASYKKAEKVYGKRVSGEDRAVQKIHAKEEVEQIEELSNGTLNSYVSKATNQAHGTLKAKASPKGMAKAYKTIVKRAEGITKAKQRFKEEVETDADTGTEQE